MSRDKNVAGDIISCGRHLRASEVANGPAEDAAALAKLFYLILSRITSSQGSKVQPADTWSEIKIKMLLSSRITIYHEATLANSLRC